MSAGVVVFVATWILVSMRRVGALPFHRPIATVAGAAALLALGVLTPREALHAIDPATMALLLGMMGMGAFLFVGDGAARAADALAHGARTRAALLGRLVWVAAVLAALVTNDAAVVLLAPVVVALVGRLGLPPLPFLLALATAANTGSAATLVGNPQNMLCASLGGLAYRDHLLVVGPAALAGVALNHALLLLLCRRDLDEQLPATPAPAPLGRPERLAAGVIVVAAVLYTLGASLPWTALGGFAALLVLQPGRGVAALRRVDWSVLAFFAGLFVVVQGLVATGLPARAFAAAPLPTGDGPLSLLRLAGLLLVGSNLVSNVPFVLVVREQIEALPDPRLGWELLTLTSTFAGNLTLLGSVANVIVAEGGRAIGGLGFWAHLRVGLPVGLATTAAGVPVVVALA